MDSRRGWRNPSPTRSLVRSRSRSYAARLHQIVSTWHPVSPGPRGGRREAYIPAQYPPTCEEARFPRPHEHARRPRRHQEPPRQGPSPTLGLIHRIRDRQSFDRLARHGTRIRRSALWCTWCPEPESTATSVAFAFSRAFGPAVQRNRIRRRIRAILRSIDSTTPLPPGLLLIGGSPALIELTFDQLTQRVQSLVAELPRSSSR